MLLDVFALPQLPYMIVFIGGLVVVSWQAGRDDASRTRGPADIRPSTVQVAPRRLRWMGE
jgi:hypothetical protein